MKQNKHKTFYTSADIRTHFQIPHISATRVKVNDYECAKKRAKRILQSSCLARDFLSVFASCLYRVFSTGDVTRMLIRSPLCLCLVLRVYTSFITVKFYRTDADGVCVRFLSPTVQNVLIGVFCVIFLHSIWHGDTRDGNLEGGGIEASKGGKG